MNKLYLDVETSGLKGRLNLVQYQINDEIKLIRPFQEPKKMEKLKELLDNNNIVVIGYNIGFDLWKLYQFYRPEKAFNCQCLDLWLHVQRGRPFKYFLLKGKSIIVVKKVPSNCVEKLENVIKNKLYSIIPRMFEINVKHSEDKENKELITLSFKLKFNLKLKTLIFLLFPEENILKIEDVFHLPNWHENKRIPIILEDEKELYENLWKKNEKILDNPDSLAWKYARKDIEYLRMLENWFIEVGNKIEVTDNDTCIHIVAFTKFYGFTTNIQLIKQKLIELKKEIKRIKKSCPINPASFKQKKELFITHALDKTFIPSSLDKKHLQLAIKSKMLDIEGEKLFQDMLNYQSLNQRLKQLEIFEQGNGKIYPDFRVFGTTTNRMAGIGGLNFQGISKDQDIRELVYVSQGGDFDGLEIAIAASYFQDQQMLHDLDNSVDLHTQTACLLNLTKFTYPDAMKIKKDKKNKEYKDFKIARNKAKGINFAILYFATHFKIGEILDLEEDETKELMDTRFFKHYPTLLKTRKDFFSKICTADTINWKRNSIEKMATEVYDQYENTKYFVIEKEIANYFWKNSQEIAEKIGGRLLGMVIRQELKGKQTYKNAILSALLGAVIGMQQSLYRQAGNFPIQSTGATLTKKLMGSIWKKFKIPMMNVHDEIMIPEGFEKNFREIKKTVQEFIKKHQKEVKHLSMNWEKLDNWSEK